MSERDSFNIYRAHPWHGIFIGEDAPAIVAAYIEIVPTDTVKYEMDKITGILKVDRPQKYSNSCPTLYGFIPQTYCGEGHGSYTAEKLGRRNIVGDGDPLDVCVLTEKVIPRGDILLRAIPIGGLRLIDKNQADDKIIAVLQNDELFGKYQTVEDCPPGFLDRLRHYFLTYKQPPGEPERPIEITHIYGKDEAYQVIDVCQQDYHRSFPEIREAFEKTYQPCQK
jgi:inorganic pyrophosphatase